jgi:hypothetical protein
MKGEVMADGLLRVSLQRLHDQLSQLVGRYVPLECWLIEWPNMFSAGRDFIGHSLEVMVPGLADSRVVWQSVDWDWVNYAVNSSEYSTGETITGIFDSQGKLVAHPRPFRIEVDVYDTPFRALHLSVHHEGRDTVKPVFDNWLKPILVDAGRLLEGILGEALPEHISAATTGERNPLERWLYFVFDLAWANIPGLPLQPQMGVTHGYSDAAYVNYAPPDRIPEPACWYSVLGDVARDSLHAIDFLLGGKGKVPNASGGDNFKICPPSEFQWKGQSPISLPPIQWKLLNYLLNHERSEVETVIADVWGHDTDVSDGTLRSTASKLNGRLVEGNIPISVHCKAGFVTLSIYES